MSFRSPRPDASPGWLIVAALAVLAAATLFAVAIGNQREASRPTGEGTLFRGDAALAAASFDSENPGTSVRRVRNSLAIEAVAVLSPEGVYRASTTGPLVGRAENDPFILHLLESRMFGAIASPIDVRLELDGVVEWPAGAVLYRVFAPLDDGSGLVLHYDVSQLLTRRAGLAGIDPLTAQLAAASALLFVMALTLLGGRTVAQRRVREAHRERLLLEKHSTEVEERNRELDSARREAERALELAEETNRIRSDFVMMINHELRTPLTSLVTGTDLLKTGVVEGPDREALLDDMARDGRRLLGLIRSVLAVARIENRGLDYRLRSTPVTEILDQVEATSGVPVGHDAPDESVLTDLDGLSQLLISLAENARAHGATKVSIAVDRDPLDRVDHLVGEAPSQALFFKVVDDGPGIDHEFLPRAFEKFEKSSFSAGTGLGLYVARLMAEAIDASIAVRTDGDGTVMCVSVPVAAMAESAA